MGDFLIIPYLNCIKITQKQAWRSLIYLAWMKSMYFREYVCRFSRKSHYFCILGVSHLNYNFTEIRSPGGRINNTPALVQIMAWCRPGAKPFSEPVIISLLTHICITQPQWVNTHWGLIKMDILLQTFSNAFSCLIRFVFYLKIHWFFFLGFQLTICQHQVR